MKDLIKALQIFDKYLPEDNQWPTCCDYDELIVSVNPKDVSKEDIVILEELGFLPSDDDEYFYSYRFGSC